MSFLSRKTDPPVGSVVNTEPTTVASSTYENAGEASGVGGEDTIVMYQENEELYPFTMLMDALNVSILFGDLKQIIYHDI